LGEWYLAPCCNRDQRGGIAAEGAAEIAVDYCGRRRKHH
jgi:hypothetical protein